MNNGYPNNAQSMNNNMNYVNNNGNAPIFKWNWGAFMMPILFGAGTRASLCFLKLLMFIPVIGQLFAFVWMFVCGASGARWAWESRTYRTPSEFNSVMESWNRAGKLIFVLVCILFVVIFMLMILLMVLGLSFAEILRESLI